MDRVSQGVSNYLVHSCSKHVVRMETTSGLGIFGLALLGPHTNEIRHEEAGWMVRMKGLESFEGSVTAGTAVVG